MLVVCASCVFDAGGLGVRNGPPDAALDARASSAAGDDAMIDAPIELTIDAHGGETIDAKPPDARPIDAAPPPPDAAPACGHLLEACCEPGDACDLGFCLGGTCVALSQ